MQMKDNDNFYDQMQALIDQEMEKYYSKKTIAYS